MSARARESPARRLGREPVVFPGDHVGFGEHPERSAARLASLLG